jgi:hypothetical protein
VKKIKSSIKRCFKNKKEELFRRGDCFFLISSHGDFIREIESCSGNKDSEH